MVSLLFAAFFGIAVAARSHDDVDPVIRQNEAAGAGFRRNLRGNCAHAGRKDRGHEAGALGVDQFGFTDRFARNEGRAHDHAGEIFDGLRPIGLADEIAAGGARRPSLPEDIRWRNVWPLGISAFATRISTVSDFGASTLGAGGFSDRPASMAATPPAAMATVSTTIRAAFIRSLSP